MRRLAESNEHEDEEKEEDEENEGGESTEQPEASELLKCEEEPALITSKVIGPDGGLIQIGRHTLLIPGGALDQQVTITAEQVADSVNSVRFGPEGLRFTKSARLTLSYENCEDASPPRDVVYINEALEILEVLKSVDVVADESVRADIDHFSRYAVAY